MKRWSWLSLTLAFTLAVGSAAFYYWPALADKVSKVREVEYASSYQILGLSCSFQDNCSQLSFTFTPSQPTLNAIPKYEIKETPEQDQTQIIFNSVRLNNNNFDYQEIINNPSIEDIKPEQIGDDLTLTISRRGPLTHPEVKINGQTVTIKFPLNDDQYPKFSKLEPADQSMIYPSAQTIKAQVVLTSQLKESLMFLNGQPIDLLTTDLGNNQYLLESKQSLTLIQDYNIKVLVIDSQNQATAEIWQFSVQKSLPKVTLGENRFQYFGWWGQINSTSTPVMEQPAGNAKQLDTFSTINRVKVLKEVPGETINGNDLWFQIDGGKHPGAYIFSAYVTAIPQPEAPKNFQLPAGVTNTDYWIDVDITKQILTLFLGDQPVFVTYISTGRPGNPTITGTYQIWEKLLKTRMRGGPPVVPFFYDLPNVPYVMYYHEGYGVHGTYWHDKFGTRQSSGCTNLTQGDAKFIFDKVKPILPSDRTSIISNADNPGTVVNNHF